jgi:hypothetical protein
MSKVPQNPFESPQPTDSPLAHANTGENETEVSPAKRGFWLGVKITAFVWTVGTVGAIGYLVYDSVTGKPIQYLVPFIVGFLCLSFAGGAMVSLMIGAMAALWMAVLSSPNRRK